MNPLNLKLQSAIVETLGLIDYWSTFNTILGLLFIIMAIFTALSVIFTGGILTGGIEDDDLTLKDKTGVYSFTATVIVIFVIVAGVFMYTPSSSKYESQLIYQTSQLSLDPQTCIFLSNLHTTNRDFSSSVALPEQCQKKDIDD